MTRSPDLLGAATEVRVLGPADTDAAAVMLARGFAEEPGNLALYPDPETRRILLETGSRNFLRATLPYGTAHGAWVGPELAAVALWHPPGASTTSLTGVLASLAGYVPNAVTFARALPHAASTMVRVAPEALALVRARRRAVARASRGPTWHLAFLATLPEHRGRGLARLLLDRQLQRCDEDGTAVWLETTDPVNPPLYERFGFTTLTYVENAGWLPGFWVMRREPHAD